jgi:hypothetical protein
VHRLVNVKLLLRSIVYDRGVFIFRVQEPFEMSRATRPKPQLHVPEDCSFMQAVENSHTLRFRELISNLI